MNDSILESGMLFNTDNTFHIEKTSAYTDLGSGIKSVEFIRRKDKALLFVEAKTSFPNPSNSEKRFDSESEDIADKFIHSLNLYASIALGLRTEDISAASNATEVNTEVKLVLVIREHETGWCSKVKKKIALLLNKTEYFREIWRPQVIVINHDTAIEFGLAENIV